MIQSISIADVATFGASPGAFDDLRQFNYIFGSNGTGKTTISRIIADSAFSTTCQCNWKNRTPLEALVLNRDFFDKTFGQGSLPGVFTLGQEQKDTLEIIEKAKIELDNQNQNRTNLRSTLEGADGNGGKKAELAQLEADYRDRFWVQKQRHDQTLDGAFRGYMGSKEAFKAKVLRESESNSATPKPLADLEKRAATIFGETPSRESTIPRLNTAALLAHESNPILIKKVVGKDDVDIAAMIKKLGNSDWVRQGIPYYEANDRVCPFCQQETTEAFAASLAEYFDETFEQHSKTIDMIVSSYETDSANVVSKIDQMIASPSKFLDAEKLKSRKALLEQRSLTNQQKLNQKRKEPSRVVELESLEPVCNSIKEVIDATNVHVSEHNRTVDNLAAEKQRLTAEIWRFVLDALAVDLNQYREKKAALKKAIAGLNENIVAAERCISEKEQEIRKLERQTTSIQPTISAINEILARFGFDSFSLTMTDDGKHYTLMRNNGEDARESLSEGEKTFVVFLYFYQLLRGSFSESGITADRIVVFDDPVSSLDSDVLFIVSSLIRQVCEDVRQKRGHIRQVFVFTHNIYFHREVTFKEKHKSGRPREESFWIVRRLGPESIIERHKVNPIKTMYELLWMDVRNPHPSKTRIENTLRRILEHYFKILGSIDRDEICAKFDGQDKLICRSLFSWVNAGSHHADDDIYLTPSDTMLKNFLRVFREIFEKSGQSGHYRMMMADAFVDDADNES